MRYSYRIKTKLTFLLSLTFLFLFSGSSVVFSDDSHDKIIKEIKSLFLKWQPILDKEEENNFINSPSLYRYVLNSIKNYNKYEWSPIQIQSDEKTLTDAIIFVEKDIGYFLNWQVYSRSDDQYLVGEHYYNTKGELYFVFFRFNTFNGEIMPVTVERRLYFDHTGKVIKELESVYRMNTKEKTNSKYMGFDNEIFYSYHLKELEFYDLLNVSTK